MSVYLMKKRLFIEKLQPFEMVLFQRHIIWFEIDIYSQLVCRIQNPDFHFFSRENFISNWFTGY